MKKYIFSLLVCSAAFASYPAFSMDSDDEREAGKSSNTVRQDLNPEMWCEVFKHVAYPDLCHLNAVDTYFFEIIGTHFKKNISIDYVFENNPIASPALCSLYETIKFSLSYKEFRPLQSTVLEIHLGQFTMKAQDKYVLQIMGPLNNREISLEDGYVIHKTLETDEVKKLPARVLDKLEKDKKFYGSCPQIQNDAFIRIYKSKIATINFQKIIPYNIQEVFSVQFTDPEQKGQNKVSPDPINFSFMNKPYGRSGNIPAELQQWVDSRKLVFRMEINVEGLPAIFQSMKKDTISTDFIIYKS